MGLFSKVIAKQCLSEDCQEYKKHKPANSPAFCDECGSPMSEIKKSNLPAILTVLTLLLLVLGGAGFFGVKFWLYTQVLKAYRQAIAVEDILEAEKYFTKLRDSGNLKKCPECANEFESLLQTKFNEALDNADIPETKRFLNKLRDIGSPDACPGCEEKIADVEKALSYRQQFTFNPVPSADYALDEYLQRYVAAYLDTNPVTVATPFAIQSGEVTVGQFRQYAESLADADRQALGIRWEKDEQGISYPDTRPVENINQQEAIAYAKWLSEKTHWKLQLPTRKQWAAACIKYPDPQPILGRGDGKASEPLAVFRKGRSVDHLLGNLREWSLDSCDDGKFYLLGENYMTDPVDPEVVGQANCAKNGKWAGVGFRLVKIE